MSAYDIPYVQQQPLYTEPALSYPMGAAFSSAYPTASIPPQQPNPASQEVVFRGPGHGPGVVGHRGPPVYMAQPIPSTAMMPMQTMGMQLQPANGLGVSPLRAPAIQSAVVPTRASGGGSAGYCAGHGVSAGGTYAQTIPSGAGNTTVVVVPEERSRRRHRHHYDHHRCRSVSPESDCSDERAHIPVLPVVGS